MRIDKDGTVFRISLDSTLGGFETRISFAVNSSGEMRRPRIEVSRNDLALLLLQILPHLTAIDMVGHNNWGTQNRSQATQQLIRLMNELADEEATARGTDPSFGLGFGNSTSKLLKNWQLLAKK